MKKILRKLFRGKSGFSLLEVILAFSLMAVSANVFLPAQAQAMTYVYKAKELRAMATDAGQKMALEDELGSVGEKVYNITTLVYTSDGKEVLQQSTTKQTFVGVIESSVGKETEMQQIKVHYTDWRELPKIDD